MEKSIVNPRQIKYVHDTFAPTVKEIAYAEKLIYSFDEQTEAGVGVYTVDVKWLIFLSLRMHGVLLHSLKLVASTTEIFNY